jgi:hypothetical protein
MVREVLVWFGALGFDVARFATVPTETLLLADHLVLDIVGCMVGGVLKSTCWPGAVRERIQPLGYLAEAPLEVWSVVDVQFVDIHEGRAQVFLLLEARLRL